VRLTNCLNHKCALFMQHLIFISQSFMVIYNQCLKRIILVSSMEFTRYNGHMNGNVILNRNGTGNGNSNIYVKNNKFKPQWFSIPVYIM
jgi:hypothetical protein